MKQRHHKYNAKRTLVDGIWFDSLKEARRYGELKLLEKAGKIFDLKVHPAYSIDIKDQHICFVELDFFYKAHKNTALYVPIYHYEDVKGRDLPMSRLKRRLVEVLYGIKVELI